MKMKKYSKGMKMTPKMKKGGMIKPKAKYGMMKKYFDGGIINGITSGLGELSGVVKDVASADAAITGSEKAAKIANLAGNTEGAMKTIGNSKNKAMKLDKPMKMKKQMEKPIVTPELEQDPEVDMSNVKSPYGNTNIYSSDPFDLKKSGIMKFRKGGKMKGKRKKAC
jgi:hypothetical protein